MAKKKASPGKPMPADDKKEPTQPFARTILNDPAKQIELLDPYMEERVVFMVEMFGESFTKRAIILAFRKQYGLSLEQTYRYLRIAEFRMKENIEEDNRKALAKAANSTETIIRKAIQDKDYRAALAARAYRDKLVGLHQDGKSFDGGVFRNLTPTLDTKQLPEPTIDRIAEWARSTARDRAAGGKP